jgi:hypothetical protein
VRPARGASRLPSTRCGDFVSSVSTASGVVNPSFAAVLRLSVLGRPPGPSRLEIAVVDPLTQRLKGCRPNSAALLHVHERAEARHVEAAAERLQTEGYPLVLNPMRIRLALARGELDRAPLDYSGYTRHRLPGSGLSASAAKLDALAAMRDRAGVEQAAAAVPPQNRYLEPFVLRALGIVREDEALLDQAEASFGALGLDWHASQTEALVQQP